MTAIALIGNPNTGKTSLFNHLTSSYAYVGNWSGVTVEKKVGIIKNSNNNLIDLPGVYTLNPITIDEGVVSKFFLNEKYDKCLNVVDSSMMEKNLHLTVQMLELGVPSVIALNMYDVSQKKGIVIDIEKLSASLKVPVLPVVARSGVGCDEIRKTLTGERGISDFTINYGYVVEEAILSFAELCPEIPENRRRWLALQVLEGNREVFKYVGQHTNKKVLLFWLDKTTNKIKDNYNCNVAEYFFNCRTKVIKSILDECVTLSKPTTRFFSEYLDRVLTHPIFGIPIFLLSMYLMFLFTFEWVGTPLSDMLASFINGSLTDFIINFLYQMNASPFIESLVIDGIIAGVGGVLVFVPQIFALFLCTSFLEDSGYMARIVYVMDRYLEKVGLGGKTFVSMIIGFGCNVPGIMVARSIGGRRERLLTMLLVPLMSCSARLPVYVLFAGAFFANNQAVVVLSLYMLGIFLALALAKLFSVTVVKGDSEIFVLELPPYRAPKWLSLWRNTWGKGKGFVKRAGTYILAGTILIWFLTRFGYGGFNVAASESFMATLGKLIAPIFSPLGFGTWEASVALLSGILAKEVVVTTFNVIYNVQGSESVVEVIQGQFTPLVAYSFMVFSLIYIPCIATIVTILKETFSTKLMLFSILYSLFLAYGLSFLIFQVGGLFF